MVFVSSIRAQVGPYSDHVLQESDEPRPTDAYGRSKLAGEQAMMAALAGGPTEGVILRPVLVYGPGVKGNMATLFRLARLPMPLPLASLSNRRSIVSIANLCSAVSHVLLAPEAAGHTFLVADAEPMSVPQIIAALRKGLGRPPGLLSVPLAPFAALLKLAGRGDVWSRVAGDLVVDTAALTSTGWRPAEDTASALAAAIKADAG
jgi:UDP-glucose 4-epimerase